MISSSGYFLSLTVIVVLGEKDGSSRVRFFVCLFVCFCFCFWWGGFVAVVVVVLLLLLLYRLGGLVVKASASGAEDPGFESRLRRDFSGSSHTSDLKIGTPVTTLPGAWHYRVSAGTGRPGVSIL